jgi:hypothetical protein
LNCNEIAIYFESRLAKTLKEAVGANKIEEGCNNAASGIG